MLNIFGASLKVYSVTQLSNVMMDALKQYPADSVLTDETINLVCKEYKITRPVLMMPRVRGDVQEARHICFCLLHLELNLPIRFIAFKIFGAFPNTVYVAIKKYRGVNLSLATDKAFMEKYIKLSPVVQELKVKHLSIK